MLDLSDNQSHYFKTVLRKQPEDLIRIFNGKDGEFLARLKFQGKKQACIHVLEQTRTQPTQIPERHIFFVLPKKKSFDLLVEKSVELGATHFHPLTSQNAQIRTLDQDRVRQQIIEACEQSERLDVPTLSAIEPFQSAIITAQNLFAAVELLDAPPLGLLLDKIEAHNPISFLTGPEGGFTAQERQFLEKQQYLTVMSLGQAILKVETAIFFCLSAAKLKGQNSGIV